MGFGGVLEPGQMLYVPPYWFHQIDTIDDANISMPIRFDSDQSPDLDLFQLSQKSNLRPLTNHPTKDVSAAIEVLRANRAAFAAAERQFVNAMCEARDLDVDPDAVIRAVGDSG